MCKCEYSFGDKDSRVLTCTCEALQLAGLVMYLAVFGCFVLAFFSLCLNNRLGNTFCSIISVFFSRSLLDYDSLSFSIFFFFLTPFPLSTLQGSYNITNPLFGCQILFPPSFFLSYFCILLKLKYVAYYPPIPYSFQNTLFTNIFNLLQK